MIQTKTPDNNDYCSRDVAIFDDVVVKSARGKMLCRRQSQKEAALWNRVKRGKNKKFFAPVLASCPEGSWVVMARIKETRKPTNEAKKKVGELARYYGLYDVHRREDGTHNWFMTDDGPVIVDYGV